MYWAAALLLADFSCQMIYCGSLWHFALEHCQCLDIRRTISIIDVMEPRFLERLSGTGGLSGNLGKLCLSCSIRDETLLGRHLASRAWTNFVVSSMPLGDMRLEDGLRRPVWILSSWKTSSSSFRMASSGASLCRTSTTKSLMTVASPYGELRKSAMKEQEPGAGVIDHTFLQVAELPKI